MLKQVQHDKENKFSMTKETNSAWQRKQIQHDKGRDVDLKMLKRVQHDKGNEFSMMST
jgi:hypothetical protein